MDSMIRRLYSDMFREEGNKDKISLGTMEEIKDLLGELEQLMGDQEYKRCSDMVFLLASAAEENGFVRGFNYAFRLFTECMHQ